MSAFSGSFRELLLRSVLALLSGRPSLDVPMRDALSMRVIERVEDLNRHPQTSIWTERSSRDRRPALRPPRARARGGDAIRLFESANRGDARMIERGEQVRLAFESREPLAIGKKTNAAAFVLRSADGPTVSHRHQPAVHDSCDGEGSPSRPDPTEGRVRLSNLVESDGVPQCVRAVHAQGESNHARPTCARAKGRDNADDDLRHSSSTQKAHRGET
jgi:hypothetical protein